MYTMTEAFVYCWTDHKTSKLYVGSHKGSTDDGYVCSSKYMMEEYRKRPEDFTRQIVAEGRLDDIRKLESSILKSVKARLDEQFYNKHDNDGLYFDGWKKGEFSDEHRKNMSIAASKRMKKRISKEHLTALHEGRRNSKNSEEHNRKISEKNTGRKLSEESIVNARNTRKMNNDTSALASHAGKISMEKYKNDPERKKQHSERMKLWWAERKSSKIIGG